MLSLLVFFVGIALTAGQQLVDNSVFVPSPGGAPQFAYATIHYEGTSWDDEYVLAVRVLAHSIRKSGSPHPFVVICDHSVRQSSMEQFVKDGLTVTLVDAIANPYKNDPTRRLTYRAHHEFTLNKIYLWKLLKFERVVYFDADNTVLHNMDEAFRCCHFCAVFMNQVNFHTGVMVLKPDAAVFDSMLKQLQVLNSYDGADQGFFASFFKNMQDAPQFKIDGPDQRNEPKCRLPYGYNLHHIYYYERMGWHLHRANSPRFGNYSIPALSLTFPITPIAKPWIWWPYFFFGDIHWEWQNVRMSLEPDWKLYILGHALMVVCYGGVALWLQNAVHDAKAPSRVAVIRDRVGHIIRRIVVDYPYYGPNLVSMSFWAVFCVLWGCIALASPPFFPPSGPPQYTWPLFLPLHTINTYFFINLFAMLTLQLQPPARNVILPILAIQIAGVYLLTRTGAFEQFLQKIWTTLSLGALLAITELNWFRGMAYAIQRRQQQGKLSTVV